MSQLLAVRVFDSSADWVAVLLSFCKQDDQAILPTQRVAEQCSQHDAYVAVPLAAYRPSLRQQS